MKTRTRKSNSSKFGAQIWLGLLVSMMVYACGGARNGSQGTGLEGDEMDIDQMLSGEDQPSNQQSDEDEVLRLLGIVPETKEATETAEPVSEVKSTAAPEVESLRRELNEKVRRIADLESDVGVKEQRIESLEDELAAARRELQQRGRDGGRPSFVSNDYASRYAQARSLYEQRRYRDAIEAFTALLAEDDRNSLSDNSQYWIGESYYGLGNYAQSIAEFEKVFTFPRSDKNDDALLKLGLCYLRMGDRRQARSEFEQLLANYPKSEYVGKARYYLNRL